MRNGQRARAAREARGLRVDEDRLAQIDLFVEIGQTAGHPARLRQQFAQRISAVHVIGRVAFEVHEARAVVRLDDLAVDQALRSPVERLGLGRGVTWRAPFWTPSFCRRLRRSSGVNGSSVYFRRSASGYNLPSTALAYSPSNITFRRSNMDENMPLD